MDSTREINTAIYNIAVFFIQMGIVAVVVRFLLWGWVRRYAAWIAISYYGIRLMVAAVGLFWLFVFNKRI